MVEYNGAPKTKKRRAAAAGAADGAVPAPPGESDAALHDDVAAFAAQVRDANGGSSHLTKAVAHVRQSAIPQLGLGGNASGFNDVDFRPKKKAPPPAADVRLVAKARPRGKAAVAGADEAAGPPAEPHAKAVKPPGRGWNEGAGPRPTAIQLSAPTVFGPDEPRRWHDALAALPSLPSSDPAVPDVAGDDLVSRLRAAAERTLDAAAAAAEQRAGGDARWLQTVRRSGTTADKLAAWTLLVQEYAVGAVRSLDALVTAAESKAKRPAGEAIDALRELFSGGALLPDRKLRRFEAQPLAASAAAAAAGATIEPRRWAYWLMEDVVASRYARFVGVLATAARDPLAHLKAKAMKAAAALLAAKPEQERPLLQVLVNKLGDPERATSSKAGYLLAGVLATHPAMAGVVAQEVAALAARPGVGLRAQYVCVVFLSQLVLSHRGAGPALARQLVVTYFELFGRILGPAPTEGGGTTTGGTASTIAAGRGSGHSRGHGRGRGRGRGRGGCGGGRGKKPSTMKGAKAAAAAAAAASASAAARDSGGGDGVDARVLGALLTGVNRALPYVASGDVESLLAEHTPQLYRLAHGPHYGAALQALTLLCAVLNARDALSDRFYRAVYASLLAPGVARGAKPALLMSLLLKVFKSDADSKRAAAGCKRLLQVAMHMPAHWACGALMLLSEVLKAKPGLWAAILQPEAHAADDVEQFADADRAQVAANVGGGDPALENAAGSPPDTPWPAPGQYDMRKREPAHCGAGGACWWELTALSSHAHPSTAAMAHTLLLGASVTYGGNPVRDLTPAAFLDRFLLKKAKAPRGGSVPAAGVPHPDPAYGPEAAGDMGAPAIGTPGFVRLSEADVRADDVFFHRFYTAKAKGDAAAKTNRRARQLKKNRAGDDDDDDEDVEGDDDSGREDADDDLGLVEDIGGETTGPLDFGSDSDEDDVADFLDAAAADGGEPADGVDFDYGDLAAALAADGEDQNEEENTGADDGEGDDGEEGGEGLGDDDDALGRLAADHDDDNDDEGAPANETPVFASADDYAHLFNDGGQDEAAGPTPAPPPAAKGKRPRSQTNGAKRKRLNYP